LSHAARPCNPPSPGWLVASDIDGTLVDQSFTVTGEERRAAELLAAASVPLVFATSKTLDEARIYARKLRLPEDCPGYAIIAEEGAVVEASTPSLLPEERLILARAPPRPEKLLPPRCRGAVRNITEMSPEEVSGLTGLPPAEAEAATRRRYTLALHGPRRCLEEARERAAGMGLYARLGRVFLIVGHIWGKAAALRELLRRSPRLRHARLIALGDNEMDLEMLEEADIAIVVPPPRGHWPRPRRSDYLIAPAPAPKGWAAVIEKLAERLAAGMKL